MAYLPKEKLLLEADLVNTHEPLPATLSNDQESFYRAVQALKLDVSQIVPVHGTPVPWTNFSKLAASPTN